MGRAFPIAVALSAWQLGFSGTRTSPRKTCPPCSCTDRVDRLTSGSRPGLSSVPVHQQLGSGSEGMFRKSMLAARGKAPKYIGLTNVQVNELPFWIVGAGRGAVALVAYHNPLLTVPDVRR